jgi:predicted NUDIX family NTP pyrophosphohydrolase
LLLAVAGQRNPLLSFSHVLIIRRMLRWFAIPQARKYIRLEQEPLLDRLEQAVVDNAGSE